MKLASALAFDASALALGVAGVDVAAEDVGHVDAEDDADADNAAAADDAGAGNDAADDVI